MASMTGRGLAQVMGSSFWARNRSRVLLTRNGRSGWPGAEYSRQRSSVMIFMSGSGAGASDFLFSCPDQLSVASGQHVNSICIMSKILFAVVTLGASSSMLPAWDYEGHRLVNQLALASLPANFPAFVKPPAAQERV